MTVDNENRYPDRDRRGSMAGHQPLRNHCSSTQGEHVTDSR